MANLKQSEKENMKANPRTENKEFNTKKQALGVNTKR